MEVVISRCGLQKLLYITCRQLYHPVTYGSATGSQQKNEEDVFAVTAVV